MELKKFSCPHCGASVSFDGDKDKFFCAYCGGQIVIDDGVQKTKHEESINKRIEIDAKHEYTHNVNINDLAAVEKVRNEVFLNKYKVRMVIAGAIILLLLIGLHIVKIANTKTYMPKLKDSVVIDKKTTADFLEVVMDKIKGESILIVAEQEVNVQIDITQQGLIKWNVFKKSQQVRDYGIVQYTVDLNRIDEDDIMYDEETDTLTIYSPTPEIHKVTLEPEKREVGDPDNGFLAWGSVKLDQEKSAALDAEAIEKIRQTAEETVDMDTIEDEAAKALKKLLSVCVSDSTRLRIVFD